jgi:hypothetical protein
VVVCHCPVPPPLIPTLQNSMTCDDAAAGAIRDLDPGRTTVQGRFGSDSAAVAASSKMVDDLVEHPPEAEQTENICPNMTNKEFVRLVLRLRGMAIDLVKKRINDLDAWGRPEQQRAAKWFGVSDENLRQYLKAGLQRTLKVLNELSGDNFVRYSEQAMRNVGCTASGNKVGLAAEVCGPDTKTHTIGIALEFCTLPDISYRIDSQVGTLIHEVTHFHDTFSSKDTIYNMGKSLALASQPSLARANADSITGYVLYGD